MNEEHRRRVQDQHNFSKWVKKIKIQNEGVFLFHDKKFVYDTQSLHLFKSTNFFRRLLVRFAEWTWFDRIVVLLILVASFC